MCREQLHQRLGVLGERTNGEGDERGGGAFFPSKGLERLAAQGARLHRYPVCGCDLPLEYSEGAFSCASRVLPTVVLLRLEPGDLATQFLDAEDACVRTAREVHVTAKAAKVVGFEDLGMEAIYEFEVRDMPVTVAVDSSGTSVHQTGPREWQGRIGKIPVATV